MGAALLPVLSLKVRALGINSSSDGQRHHISPFRWLPGGLNPKLWCEVDHKFTY